MTISMAKRLIGLYQRFGGSAYQIGESITQKMHAEQAGYFAAKSKQPEFMIVAALVHDVGNLAKFDKEFTEFYKKQIVDMDDLGIEDHDQVGKHYLEYLGLDEKICRIVGAHVLAKRYLITRNKKYYDKLSEASKKTFIRQGGMMTAGEMKQFRENPERNLILMMRAWDDMAKLENFPVLLMESYEPTIDRFIRSKV